MTDKEKLVRLLYKPFLLCKINELSDTGDIADHLIANGVTIQRWIPVAEQLPEIGVVVLVCLKNGYIKTNVWFGRSWWDAHEGNPVTHWMTLPAPPKEME